jgi:hypothetical protein
MKLTLKGILTVGLLVMSKIVGKAGATESCETPRLEKQAIKLPVECKDFTLTAGEATTHTLRWFLGELHDQKQKTSACLDALTKDYPKHTVAVEGAQAGKAISCPSKSITNRAGRTCIGWDDTASVKQLTDLGGLNIVITCVQQWAQSFRSARLTDSGIDDYFKRILANPELLKPKGGGHASTSDIECMQDAAKWLLAQRNVGKSYKELFAQANQNQDRFSIGMDEYKRWSRANKKRHSNLFQTIKTIPANEPAVVIIGKHHVVKDVDDDSQMDAAQSDDLHQRLQTDKTIAPGTYAVLAMKKV